MKTVTVKTTTVVTRETVHTVDGKTIRTTETATTVGADPELEKAVEQAVHESNAAVSRLWDGFDEKVRAIFAPFERLFEKKP